VIEIKLKEVKHALARLLGKRVTYADLARWTGISKDTLSPMASRKNYNASLAILSIICRRLAVTPGELLDLPEAEKADMAARREAWARGTPIKRAPAFVGKRRRRKSGKSAKKTGAKSGKSAKKKAKKKA
jgi:DNA-binding Xre family transcriptional regulator